MFKGLGLGPDLTILASTTSLARLTQYLPINTHGGTINTAYSVYGWNVKVATKYTQLYKQKLQHKIQANMSNFTRNNTKNTKK